MKTPIAAIDVHAHYGDYVHANALLRRFSSGTPAEVVDRARACGVAWTIVSPLAGLLPRGLGQPVAAANEAAFHDVPATPGLLQYVIVNPLQTETYDQARRMLKAPWCVGISAPRDDTARATCGNGAKRKLLSSSFQSGRSRLQVALLLVPRQRRPRHARRGPAPRRHPRAAARRIARRTWSA